MRPLSSVATSFPRATREPSTWQNLSCLIGWPWHEHRLVNDCADFVRPYALTWIDPTPMLMAPDHAERAAMRYLLVAIGIYLRKIRFHHRRGAEVSSSTITRSGVLPLMAGARR